ncbi:hypothetical protein R3I94_019464 [Phoxinus phoxinus]
MTEISNQPVALYLLLVCAITGI